jgi:hypothetical protein
MIAVGDPTGESVALAIRGTGAPIDSAYAWAQLAEWLPQILSELLGSEVYGIDNRPPKGQRGVYVFTERGKHLYVGRTGITARSRASGAPPITSFRHRFDQHTQPGRPPGAASFANRLMRKAAMRRGIEIPSHDGTLDRRRLARSVALWCGVGHLQDLNVDVALTAERDPVQREEWRGVWPASQVCFLLRADV